MGELTIQCFIDIHILTNALTLLFMRMTLLSQEMAKGVFMTTRKNCFRTLVN